MSEQFSWCPSPPLYRVEWENIEQEFPALRLLAGCPQDSVHHAEGNVLIHTRMVVEALVSIPEWQALPSPERRIVFTAALLHDVAKPACTRIEDDGRITSRGHSKRGAIMARSLLWSMDLPLRPESKSSI
jgi:putative nucleotidyltransferase with HDIG domain